MALGTVTPVTTIQLSGANLHIVDVQLTSGANYTAGGEGFDVAQVPAASGKILAVVPVGANTTNSPMVVWDKTNKKLKLYGTAAAATGFTECTAGGDFSTYSSRCLVITDGL